MRCLKQGLCILLLAFLVVSPAFCGWDAFRKSSSASSMESLDSMKEVTQEVPQETLSPEEETESKKMSESCETYEDNSASYEEKLAEAEEVLIEAEEVVAEDTTRKAEKKRDAVEEAKAIVDELIVSKAALDENYNVLADVALQQEKKIQHLERQEDFKFGLGLVFGYRWLDTMSLGIGTHFLFNEEWDIGVEATYDVHALGGIDQFKAPKPENVEVRVGITKYF